jgi:hypothetical protein
MWLEVNCYLKRRPSTRSDQLGLALIRRWAWKLFLLGWFIKLTVPYYPFPLTALPVLNRSCFLFGPLVHCCIVLKENLRPIILFIEAKVFFFFNDKINILESVYTLIKIKFSRMIFYRIPFISTIMHPK